MKECHSIEMNDEQFPVAYSYYSFIYTRIKSLSIKSLHQNVVGKSSILRSIIMIFTHFCYLSTLQSFNTVLIILSFVAWAKSEMKWTNTKWKKKKKKNEMLLTRHLIIRVDIKRKSKMKVPLTTLMTVQCIATTLPGNTFLFSATEFTTYIELR